jgi:hypothetical protein
MIRQFGDGFDFLRPREQARGSGQVFGPVEPLRWMKGRNATNRSLRQVAFDRRKSKDVFRAQAEGKRVDELAYIDFGAIFGHMPTDRLFFRERLNPGYCGGRTRSFNLYK